MFLFTNDITPHGPKAGFFKKFRLLNSTPTIATSVSSFNISTLVPKVVAIQVVNMHMVDNIIPLLCHIAIHETHPSVYLVYSLAVFSSTCRIWKSPLPQKSSLFPFLRKVRTTYKLSRRGRFFVLRICFSNSFQR